MNWYYAQDGRQLGPVPDDEFQRLRATGVITAPTLVWREGMTDWRACGEVVAPAAPPPPPPAPIGEPAITTPALGLRPAAGLICSGCGKLFPEDEVVRLGSGFVCAACKPAAVQRLREGVTSNTHAEQIRNEHIKHEASVKSVGFLYLLGGALVLGGSGMGLLGMIIGSAGGGGVEGVLLGGGLFGLLLLVGGVQLAAGLALRRLKPWSRIAACVISGIGLLGFPIGTIINAYILYLMLSAKGRMVFSDEYREIIAQTPHIKYRTSIIVWIFLGILLLIVGLAIVGFLFSGSSRVKVGP